MGAARQRLSQSIRGFWLFLHGDDGHPARPGRAAGADWLALHAGHGARPEVLVGAAAGPLWLWRAWPLRHVAGAHAGAAAGDAAVAGSAAHARERSGAAGRLADRLRARVDIDFMAGHRGRRPFMPPARPRPARPGQRHANGLRHAGLCRRRRRRADGLRALGLAERHPGSGAAQRRHAGAGPAVPRAAPCAPGAGSAAQPGRAVAAPVALLAAAGHGLALGRADRHGQ